MTSSKYGSTGVQSAIKASVDTKNFIPVYPVKNLNTFCCDGNSGKLGLFRIVKYYFREHLVCEFVYTNFWVVGVFRDCMLVPVGTTVREFAAKLHPDLDKHFLFAESTDGLRLGEDTVISLSNSIFLFFFLKFCSRYFPFFLEL